eukprot:scaffold58649_cov43-Tisochrysis_lutea.AAC.1
MGVQHDALQGMAAGIREWVCAWVSVAGRPLVFRALLPACPTPMRPRPSPHRSGAKQVLQGAHKFSLHGNIKSTWRCLAHRGVWPRFVRALHTPCQPTPTHPALRAQAAPPSHSSD